MNIKQQLFKACQDFLNNSLKTIQKTISDIQNSLETETKSSAGDKHETGRAMLQLEREKAGHQLAEIQKLSEILHKIKPESHHQSVALGSVVYTTQSNYFIAISAGEIIINTDTFYAISPATPMAKLLFSKVVGDTIEFRDTKFTIKEIQ